MNMYSGLLPPGLTEADLSSEDADVKAEDRGETETNEHRSCQSDTETHLSRNLTDLQTDPVEDDCPPGVSPEKWQRFKDLQKAKDDQRGKQPQRKRQRKRRHKKSGTSTQNCNTQQNRKLEEERKDNWKELTQYFGINDRLKPPPCNRPPPLSGLEKSIESSIAEGEFEKAEELSDRLATREAVLHRWIWCGRAGEIRSKGLTVVV
ncbi:Protein FAM204A [Triplophysa tibetana]|uniref:Protein FAM204A n=1 Tax=Triplophysa tibetana TaxID=1572043 RepID=A0A5A9PB42_9TELE|nr:Protein FAM204A [Triplophysa tibetana]